MASKGSFKFIKENGSVTFRMLTPYIGTTQHRNQEYFEIAFLDEQIHALHIALKEKAAVYAVDIPIDHMFYNEATEKEERRAGGTCPRCQKCKSIAPYAELTRCDKCKLWFCNVKDQHYQKHDCSKGNGVKRVEMKKRQFLKKLY